MATPPLYFDIPSDKEAVFSTDDNPRAFVDLGYIIEAMRSDEDAMNIPGYEWVVKSLQNTLDTLHANTIAGVFYDES